MVRCVIKVYVFYKYWVQISKHYWNVYCVCFNWVELEAFIGRKMFFCVRRPVGHLIGFQYTSESDVGQYTKALGHRLPPDVRFLRVLSIQSNPPLFVSLDVMSDSPAFLRPCTMLFVGAIPFHASDFRSCTGPQSWIAANAGMSRRRRPVRVSRVKTREDRISMRLQWVFVGRRLSGDGRNFE